MDFVFKCFSRFEFHNIFALNFDCLAYWRIAALEGFAVKTPKKYRSEPKSPCCFAFSNHIFSINHAVVIMHNHFTQSCFSL